MIIHKECEICSNDKWAPAYTLGNGCAIQGEQGSAILFVPFDRTVEPSEVDRQGSTQHFSRGFGDDVDDAGHGVGSPNCGSRPADDFNLFDLVGVDGKQIPENEAEEILVDGSSVEQGELRCDEGRSGGAASEIDVAGRHLYHVEAGDDA